MLTGEKYRGTHSTVTREQIRELPQLPSFHAKPKVLDIHKH
jgi:hypothetical protein